MCHDVLEWSVNVFMVILLLLFCFGAVGENWNRREQERKKKR